MNGEGGSVRTLRWQYSRSCFHSFWTCPALRNTEEEAIIESQHLIEELDVNRIAFFNRALVQEEELKIDDTYAPLEEYDLQINWNRLYKPTEPYIPEPRLFEPLGSRRLCSPDRNEPKPVLSHLFPAWLQDNGVDELLNQVGYTTGPHGGNRNPPGRSSMDDPEMEIDIADIEQEQPDLQEDEGAQVETENNTECTETPIGNQAYPNGWPSGYYFGDGSGGKYSRYPTITRCGVGVHYVDPQKQPVFDASMPLPGEIQSNNRAEIYAILITVRNIEIVGKIDFFTDNKTARNTYNKGKHRARLACHADLWSELFTLIVNISN